MSHPAVPLSDLLQQGLSAHQQGDHVQAESLYQKVLELQPDQPDALHLLGVLAYQRGDPDLAVTLIEEAIHHHPAVALYHFNLANAYAQLDRSSEAEASYRQAIQQDPQTPLPYVHLGQLLQKQDRLEEAEEQYQTARQLGYQTAQLHRDLGWILWSQDRIAAAQYHYEQALQLEPDDLATQITARTLLPQLYDHQDSISDARHRFEQGLSYLTDLPLEDPAVATQVYSVLAAYQLNFHLAYQGYNDRPLQEQLGQVIRRVMQCLYPHWSQPRSQTPVTDRIRIGYLSSCFYRHTVGRLALGWIQEADRHPFEMYCYHVGATEDPFTSKFRHQSDHFHHLTDLEAIAQQILADQLHILVILDIGLQPLTHLIGALRLAPVQCSTWLHPMTSGLPTIDYFLSSDLMEPPQGEEHYTETLIRLPHLGIRYDYPQFPHSDKGREAFQLSTTDVIYLCCQSLDKYLPQYDDLFPAIAQQIPAAKFVFLAKGRAASVELFRHRLQRAFRQRGLNSTDHCQILPRLNWQDYVALNRLSDLFLDSLLWSGGNTTLEAIACDLPVVTCPGPWMRGRHTYVILQVLGITETIAQDQQEYVDIAVRLGLDPSYRQEIRERIHHNKSRVFEDRSGIEGLERFYQQIVHDSAVQ